MAGNLESANATGVPNTHFVGGTSLSEIGAVGADAQHWSLLETSNGEATRMTDEVPNVELWQMLKKSMRYWENPDRAYVFWQTMLIAAVVSSCGFNGLHAALGSGSGIMVKAAAIFGAIIPPLFFFAIAEGVLMIWNRQLSRVGTLLLGTLVLSAAAAAGSRSFFGLVDFSRRFDVLDPLHDGWLVYALPVATDALAIAATLVLFELKGAPERRRRKKVKKQEEDIATIGIIPRIWTKLFGGARQVPTLPETPQVTSAGTVPMHTAVHHNGHTVPVPVHTAQVPLVPERVHGQVSVQASERVPVQVSAPSPERAPGTGAGTVTGTPARVHEHQGSVDHHALAQHLIDTKVLSIPHEKIVRAMELRAAGRTRDQIADEVPMAAKTASKVLAALRDAESNSTFVKVSTDEIQNGIEIELTAEPNAEAREQNSREIEPELVSAAVS